LHGHDRDDVILRVHADYGEFNIVGEHLALVIELDGEDRVEPCIRARRSMEVKKIAISFQLP
jgi:hypothetical protein